MSSLAEEVDEVAQRAGAAAQDPADEEYLNRLMEEAASVGRAWSGSNLGYHSLIFYDGFKAPPAGSAFNREWGLTGAMWSVTEGWAQHGFSEVHDMILQRAGVSDLEPIRQRSLVAIATLTELRSTLDSIGSTAVASAPGDEFLKRQLDEVRKVKEMGIDTARSVYMPRGSMMTRDPRWDGTLLLGPHQEVIAQVISISSPYQGLKRLAGLSSQIASHLRRATAQKAVQKLEGEPVGSGKVFIGHGRSREWMALGQFLDKRLGLEFDEYTRIPTAGISTAERLQAMLDSASFAFLVLTAEDEQMDGQIAARQNVVHEVGLFQGRLGLRRAIVMLEEGCEEFSNIAGLGQIRFTKGAIERSFEEVRATLEREGVLISMTPPAAT